MEWMEISVVCDEETAEAAANAFAEAGAGGAVIEDPRLISRYAAAGFWDDWEFPPDITDAEGVTVKGYLAADDMLEVKKENLFSELALISSRMGRVPFKVFISSVNQEDWANAWKKYFHPFRIGRRTVICPSWEECETREGDIFISIDPGMAFGTGTHATTSLAVELLDDFVEEGMKIADVGCGSGILSIFACLAGAASADAADYDSTAVRVAAENAAVNGLGDRINVFASDLMSSFGDTYDLVAANIVADIILRLSPQVPAKLNPGGIYVVSGIVDGRKDEVEQAVCRQGFTLLGSRERDGWNAMAFRKED